eukprot:gene19592-26274_t
MRDDVGARSRWTQNYQQNSMISIFVCIAYAIACVALVCFLRARVLDTFVSKGWISQFVDDVFVITLPSRSTYIKGVMEELRIAPTFLPAVQGADLDRTELLRAGFITDTCTLQLSQIACALSHNQALQLYFSRPEARTALIFEDDIAAVPVSMQNDLIERFYDMSSQVPNDWDIINLGRCWDTCKRNDMVGKGVLRSYRALCRHAYIVNRKGAMKLIKGCAPLAGTIQSDEMISALAQAGSIKMYVPHTAFFKQNREAMGSTLGNNFPQKECADE